MSESDKGGKRWRIFRLLVLPAVVILPPVIVVVVTGLDPLTSSLAIDGAEYIIMIGVALLAGIYFIGRFIRLKYF